MMSNVSSFYVQDQLQLFTKVCTNNGYTRAYLNVATCGLFSVAEWRVKDGYNGITQSISEPFSGDPFKDTFSVTFGKDQSVIFEMNDQSEHKNYKDHVGRAHSHDYVFNVCYKDSGRLDYDNNICRILYTCEYDNRV